MNQRVVQHKYDHARESAARIGYAHIAFLFILLLYMPGEGWMVNGRTVYCIISAFMITALQYVLNMAQVKYVVVVIVTYLSIVFVELMTCGIPRQLIDIDASLSKGVMFEMLLSMIPVVYVGLRIVLVFLFLPLLKWSRLLESTKG